LVNLKHLYKLQVPKNYPPHCRICLLTRILFQSSTGEFSTQSASAAKMLSLINKEENYFRRLRFIKGEVSAQRQKGRRVQLCHHPSQLTKNTVALTNINHIMLFKRDDTVSFSMHEIRVWSIDEIILTRENRCIIRKTCSNATLSNENPIWTGLFIFEIYQNVVWQNSEFLNFKAFNIYSLRATENADCNSKS